MTGLDSHCSPGKCCICNMEGLCLSLRDDLFVLAPKWEIEDRLKRGGPYQVYEIALMRKTLDDIEQEEKETKEKEMMAVSIKTVDVEKEKEAAREERYKAGLEEAWEIARKVLLGPSNGGYTPREHVEIFKMSHIDVMRDLTIHEVKEKIAAYEADQAKPKLGDVVKCTAGSTKFIGIYYGKGSASHWILVPGDVVPQKIEFDWTIEKTGKHFDIQSMFDEIG